MFQLPGASQSGNKPSDIGKTLVVKTTLWTSGSTSSVTRLAYGGGYFFGGRGTSNFAYIQYPATGNVSQPASTVSGQSNSAQQPSYQNGYFIMPTSTTFQYSTNIAGSSWSSVTLPSQVNKVIYVSNYATWIAGLDNATPSVSTAAINSGWASRTFSPSIASAGSMDTDGSRVIVGTKNGQMLYFEGNSSTATTISHPFGASASFRSIRYHPQNGVWTAGTTTGLIGYSETSNGASGWTLITPNFAIAAAADGDLLFANNRWVAVASAGNSNILISISGTSSVTSTFTSQSVTTKLTNGNDIGNAATDGNFIALLSGSSFAYSRS